MWSCRAPTRTHQVILFAAPQRAEKTVKIAIAAYSMGFRPTISDTRPLIGPWRVMARVYAWTGLSMGMKSHDGTNRSDPLVFRGRGLEFFGDGRERSGHDLGGSACAARMIREEWCVPSDPARRETGPSRC